MKNYVDIPVPEKFQNALPALKWAKKNCPSYITNDAVQHRGVYYYRFFFGKERDVTAFALKWA